MHDVNAIRFGASTVVLSHVTHYETYLSGLTVHLDGGGSVVCSKEESDDVVKFLDQHFRLTDLTKRPPAADDDDE